jgi:hypothetical protein
MTGEAQNPPFILSYDITFSSVNILFIGMHALFRSQYLSPIPSCVRAFFFWHLTVAEMHQKHPYTYVTSPFMRPCVTIANSNQNGILKPKGCTRAEFAPFSHEPGLE